MPSLIQNWHRIIICLFWAIPSTLIKLCSKHFRSGLLPETLIYLPDRGIFPDTESPVLFLATLNFWDGTWAQIMGLFLRMTLGIVHCYLRNSKFEQCSNSSWPTYPASNSIIITSHITWPAVICPPEQWWTATLPCPSSSCLAHLLEGRCLWLVRQCKSALVFLASFGHV